MQSSNPVAECFLFPIQFIPAKNNINKIMYSCAMGMALDVAVQNMYMGNCLIQNDSLKNKRRTVKKLRI